jgi:aryl-alcohol dehydrogenase-like predicted oxidoreductase
MPSETAKPTKAPDAALSGTFRIGGELAVNRLGFGAMRVTGRGIWGEPADRAEALRTLRRVPELGINFIDTADSYGPDVSERLLREALHPYEGLVIATKGGLTRPGPSDWVPHGDPDYLIAQAEKSLAKLGVNRIDLWQLHRIDPKVPREAQFAAVKQLLDSKIIRFAGLSNVSVEDIEAASKVFPVATVQNHYLSTAETRPCSRTARQTASASFPGIRSAAATSANRARPSPQWHSATTRPWGRSHSPGS